MAEFSSMGHAFNKLKGYTKQEVDDDEATVKSDIEHEPVIKTEENSTPEPGHTMIESDIKLERFPVKHKSKPAPFPSNIAGGDPALDNLNLSTLTADGLAEDIKAAQYYQARIRKALELFSSPVAAGAATDSTTQHRPSSSAGGRIISRASRKSSQGSHDHGA